MAVNPLEIVEQQLEYLKSRSEKGLLTETEVQSLCGLVKLQVILKTKAKTDNEDPYADMSTEELKSLVSMLG